MAENTKKSFSFTYELKDSETYDSIDDITYRFDNPKDDAAIAKKLNSWLAAIGSNLEVTIKKV